MLTLHKAQYPGLVVTPNEISVVVVSGRDGGLCGSDNCMKGVSMMLTMVLTSFE
jgi:hypothetical protein